MQSKLVVQKQQVTNGTLLNQRVSTQQRNHQQSKQTTYRMGGNLANYASHKGLVSSIYKELKPIYKKKVTLLKSRQKNMNTFQKKTHMWPRSI